MIEQVYEQLCKEKPKVENSMSYEDVTNMLQVGRDTECGRMIIDRYIDCICNNPRVSKIKIGSSNMQLIDKIKDFYNKIESNDPRIDIVLKQKNNYNVDFNKDKIDVHRKVFDQIASGKPPRQLTDLINARDDLSKVENYAKKTGISAIVNS